MATTNADERTLCVVVAARSMLTSISAQLLPTASIAKATIPPLASTVLSSSKNRPFWGTGLSMAELFSRPVRLWLLRHLDQCPPARTHRPSGPAKNLKKLRSRRPVTESQLLSRLRQTPRGTLRPRVPREQCPVLPISQGPANLRKKGPLGTQSVVLAITSYGLCNDFNLTFAASSWSSRVFYGVDLISLKGLNDVKV